MWSFPIRCLSVPSACFVKNKRTDFDWIWNEGYAIRCHPILVLFNFLQSVVWLVRNVMAHAQKPDFVFPRNGRVHLNRWGRLFSRLLAAEVCASARVMLDRPRSEVAWEYWLPTPFASFPFTSPPVRHRVPPGSEGALPVIHWILGWVGSRTSLKILEKRKVFGNYRNSNIPALYEKNKRKFFSISLRPTFLNSTLKQQFPFCH